MRLLAAPLAALLLISCTDDHSDSSPTRERTVTSTPEPGPCSGSNLYGALISAEEREGFDLLTVGVSSALTSCTVFGPPAITWYREDGVEVSAFSGRNMPCASGATDYSSCIFEDKVLLAPEGVTPAPGVGDQAVAAIRLRQDTICESPAQTAHFVGLQFPSGSLDVRVELTKDVQVPRCGLSVLLYGYGPKAKAAE